MKMISKWTGTTWVLWAIVSCGPELTNHRHQANEDSASQLELNPSLNVTGFALIDADSNQIIPGYGNMIGTAIIAKDELPTTNLSVRVLAAAGVKSVKMQYQGPKNQYSHRENSRPFSLYGDNNGDFHPGLKTTNATISATGYSRPKAQGVAGSTLSVDLKFVESLGKDLPNPIDSRDLVRPKSPLYFVLQGVQKTNVTDQDLQNKLVDGLSIRFRWAAFEPAPDQFDHSYILKQVNRARQLNKPYMLRLMGGQNAPQWLYSQMGVKGHVFIERGETHKMPLPWDKILQERLKIAYKVLANKYPDVWMTHISGVSRRSAEFHEPKTLKSVPGYSVEKMEQAWTTIGDYMGNVFPKSFISLNTPKYTYGPHVINNLLAERGRQLAVQHNSLKAATSPTATHHRLVVDAEKKDAFIGFQMVGPSTNEDRFGGPFSSAINLGRQSGSLYYEIYRPDIRFIPHR